MTNTSDPAYKQKAQNVVGRVKYDLYRNSISGTVFYLGCDDRYKEGDAVNAKIFTDTWTQKEKAILLS